MKRGHGSSKLLHSLTCKIKYISSEIRVAAIFNFSIAEEIADSAED